MADRACPTLTTGAWAGPPTLDAPMAAKMLELECPGCDELLELDSGFAGGVCRCSTCGTLMTVPADPARQGVERLVRPTRPGGKVHRPSQPTGPSTTPAAPPRARPDRPSRPARPDSPVTAPRPSADQPTTAAAAAAAAAADADAGTEIYTTESGRIVRVDRRAIPTARKRKVARYATYGVVIAVIAVIVTACVFAAVVLVRTPPAPPSQETVTESFTFDPAVNPFTLDKANVLGLPLRERTSIVVDASAASADWLDHVKRALSAGLLARSSSSQVNLVYAGSRGPVALPGGVQVVSELAVSQVSALHSQVAARGESDLPAAVELAAGSNPTHLVVIASTRPTPQQMAAIDATLATLDDPYVDVVAIDGDIVALDDLARQHGGRYVRISTQQLQQWASHAP